jgi:5-methylcytosine-specific restriction endonuclease McrA
METYLLYSWDDWIDPANSPQGTGFIKAAGDKQIIAPDVVACTRYDRIHIRTLYLGKRSIHLRDGFMCQYCKKRRRPKELSIDHVIPRSKNGSNSWENCVTACIECNQRKADKTLKEAGLSLDPTPTKPRWSPVASLHPSSMLKTWAPLLGQK